MRCTNLFRDGIRNEDSRNARHLFGCHAAFALATLAAMILIASGPGYAQTKTTYACKDPVTNLTRTVSTAACLPDEILVISARGTTATAKTSGHGTKKVTYSATADIYDCCFDSNGANATNGDSLLTRSDDYPNPGAVNNAIYASQIIASSTTANPDWNLRLSNTAVPTRTIYLTLEPFLPNGNYSDSVEVSSTCFNDNGVAFSWLTMASQTSYGDCTFNVEFAINGVMYWLRMSKNYDPSGRALVTCNFRNSSGCNNWSIVPNMSMPYATVANLYRNGTLLGPVYNTFRVDVTIP